MSTLRPPITAAISANGRTTYLRVNSINDRPPLCWHGGTDEQADNAARESGQRLIRHDDGTVTVEDIPREPTALELVEDLLINPGQAWNAALRRIRDAIKVGNHGGPTT